MRNWDSEVSKVKDQTMLDLETFKGQVLEQFISKDLAFEIIGFLNPYCGASCGSPSIANFSHLDSKHGQVFSVWTKLL